MDTNRHELLVARAGWARRLAVVGCAVVLTALPAAEPPAGNQTASVEDSIAAAKRELQLLKSSANAEGVDGAAAAAAPSVELPELHTANQPISLIRPAADPKLSEKPTKNWLLDAMMDPKNDAATTKRRGRDPFGASPTTPDDTLLDAKERARANPDATAKSEAQSAERPSSEPPFNPLARYMADWMSPKEYALLKPVAEKSDLDGFSGAQDSTASSSGQTGFDLSTLAGLAGTSGSANNSPVFSAPTSTENPFLAGLVAPDSGPASLPPTSQVPPVVAPPAAMPPPAAPVPAERSTIPDFAKPAIDDKYFKPLKRF